MVARESRRAVQEQYNDDNVEREGKRARLIFLPSTPPLLLDLQRVPFIPPSSFSFSIPGCQVSSFLRPSLLKPINTFAPGLCADPTIAGELRIHVNASQRIEFSGKSYVTLEARVAWELD